MKKCDHLYCYKKDQYGIYRMCKYCQRTEREVVVWKLVFSGKVKKMQL